MPFYNVTSVTLSRLSSGYLQDILGTIGPLVHWAIGPLDHWSISPLVHWYIAQWSPTGGV